MKRIRSILDELHVYPVESEGRREWIRLDLNENLWGCSPRVLERLRQLDAVDISMYSETGPLVQRLAERWDLDPSFVHLTNGGDDALFTVFLTILEPGDRVLTLYPTYSLYEPFARIAGATVHRMNIPDDFTFPMNAFSGMELHEFKMVVLTHPNNPTGTPVPFDWLEPQLQLYPGTMFLIDEAYADFLGHSFIPSVRQYPNLVVARTFSKIDGLAGLRIGYLVAQSELLLGVRKVHPPFSVNAAAVLAAMAALEDRDFKRMVLAEMAIERDYLASSLRAMGYRVDTPPTNFVLLDLEDATVAERFIAHCARHKIRIRGMKTAGLPTRVRITLAPHELMERFIRVAEGFQA